MLIGSRVEISKLAGATSAVGPESEASYKAYVNWLARKKPKKAQSQQGKIILTPDKR
jgi:hypothetical protein